MEKMKQTVVAIYHRFGCLPSCSTMLAFPRGPVEEVRECDVRGLFGANLLRTLSVILVCM
jgi:hypothetical protein